ncbi:MAG: PorT family protein [Bacteroidales bacterium]|nr:PorT family protein [Bacteroidales bacterium]
MKKVVVSVAVMLGLGLSNVQAQGVSFGVKADANMSNFILTDFADGVKSKIGFGASIGGFTKIGFSENFGLQPELLLHFKTSKMEYVKDGPESDFQYFGMEIPVYLVGQTSLGSGKGFFGVGPFLGLGFDARYKPNVGSEVELYKEYGGQDSDWQRFDFGAGAMLGYEFGSGLQISAGYKIGVINTLNRQKDDFSMLNQTISLGLGFRF